MFHCEDCDETFKTQKTLKAHSNKIHQKEYICQYCLRKLSNEYNLSRHLSSCSVLKNQKAEEAAKHSFTGLKDELKNYKQLGSYEDLYQIKVKLEQTQDKLNELNLLYKEACGERNDLKIKNDKLMQNLIQSKDETIEITKKSYLNSSYLSNNQINNNNNIHVNVTSISDLDLVKILRPITNERIAEAYKTVFNNFIDSPNNILKEEDLIPQLLSTDSLSGSIIVTDRSRNHCSWINGDQNNTLMKDPSGKSLIKKVYGVPKDSLEIKQNIQSVLLEEIKMIKQLDFEDKDTTIKTTTEFSESERFLKELASGKAASGKNIKKSGQLIASNAPDKSQYMLDLESQLNYKPLFQQHIEAVKKDWYNVYVFLTEQFNLYPEHVLFLSIDQLGGWIRTLVNSHVSHIQYYNMSSKRKKIESKPYIINVHSYQVEDKMKHEIKYLKYTPVESSSQNDPPKLISIEDADGNIEKIQAFDYKECSLTECLTILKSILCQSFHFSKTKFSDLEKSGFIKLMQNPSLIQNLCLNHQEALDHYCSKLLWFSEINEDTKKMDVEFLEYFLI